MTTQQVDFLGQGYGFPMAVDDRGGIAMVSGMDSIDASIWVILSTAHGERVMRPRFGCAIWELVFDPITDTMLGQLEVAAGQALDAWEPRIEVNAIGARRAPQDRDNGRVLIAIDYTVRATNQERNLVYPFYVIPPEEG